MVLDCFVEYHYPVSQEIEQDIVKLTVIYITKGHFFYDLITVIPYHRMFRSVFDLKYLRLFYFIKVIRIFNGLELLNPNNFMK